MAIVQRWLVKPVLHCVMLDSAPPEVKLYKVEANPPTQSLPHHEPPPQNEVGLQKSGEPEAAMAQPAAHAWSRSGAALFDGQW